MRESIQMTGLDKNVIGVLVERLSHGQDIHSGMEISASHLPTRAMAAREESYAPQLVAVEQFHIDAAHAEFANLGR